MQVKFTYPNKFIHDWIKIAGKYAQQELGLNIPEEKKVDADIWLANRMERIPKRKRRQVKVSDEFNCPTDLQAGWNNLRQKVESGDDLFPHLTRQIKNIDSRDPMLMHWRINHFHIGTVPDPKHVGLIRGGKHIVYAYVDDEAFYAIALLEHGHWEDIQLVEIIKRNWPDNKHICEEMILAHQYSHEETLELRKNQINAPTVLDDGSHYMGHGETMAGTSASATFRALPIRKIFGHIESEVRNNFSTYFPSISVKENDLINAEIFLKKDYYFAVRLPDHGLELDVRTDSIKDLIEQLKG